MSLVTCALVLSFVSLYLIAIRGRLLAGLALLAWSVVLWIAGAVSAILSAI
jgi:hypothetical protein